MYNDRTSDDRGPPVHHSRSTPNSSSSEPTMKRLRRDDSQVLQDGGNRHTRQPPRSSHWSNNWVYPRRSRIPPSSHYSSYEASPPHRDSSYLSRDLQIKKPGLFRRNEEETNPASSAPQHAPGVVDPPEATHEHEENKEPAMKFSTSETRQDQLPSNTLLVRNILYKSDAGIIKQKFAEYGPIMQFDELISSRGIAFITYYEINSAATAYKQLQGISMNGSAIHIEFERSIAKAQLFELYLGSNADRTHTPETSSSVSSHRATAGEGEVELPSIGGDAAGPTTTFCNDNTYPTAFLPNHPLAIGGVVHPKKESSRSSSMSIEEEIFKVCFQTPSSTINGITQDNAPRRKSSHTSSTSIENEILKVPFQSPSQLNSVNSQTPGIPSRADVLSLLYSLNQVAPITSSSSESPQQQQFQPQQHSETQQQPSISFWPAGDFNDQYTPLSAATSMGRLFPLPLPLPHPDPSFTPGTPPAGHHPRPNNNIIRPTNGDFSMNNTSAYNHHVPPVTVGGAIPDPRSPLQTTISNPVYPAAATVGQGGGGGRGGDGEGGYTPMSWPDLPSAQFRSGGTVAHGSESSRESPTAVQLPWPTSTPQTQHPSPQTPSSAAVPAPVPVPINYEAVAQLQSIISQMTG
ncbi:hypothetical protein D9757_011370 [Collybiopsis confluens]|uniref:RRM domain-containing protein n=1 Tax=Collybiopsis confluens TaxID=2823264 RepID=A0A8H5GAH7_9AGAR|nr:hypothetical protein D9757_011370 [Collybiopsis confluens]